MITNFLKNCYPLLEEALIHEIATHGILKSFNTNDFVVKERQYIKHLPIIYKGCIKVFCSEDTTEFLLYYIEAGESCIYSFAHVQNDEKANFSAIAEIESEILLLPLHKVKIWLQKYPSLYSIVLNNYKKHYNELLDTTKQLIFYKLEDRLTNYLRTKSQIQNSNLLTISHKEIAYDLGTSREVITRLIKKLERNQKLQQQGRKINIW